MLLARRLAGAALALAVLAPTHRLLDPARTGPAGAATLATAEDAWVLGLSGGLIVLTLAWVASRMLPSTSVRTGPFVRIWHLLLRTESRLFATLAGIVAFALASWVSSSIHGRQPTSVDELTQLLHAAALAGGRLAAPVASAPAAWVVQNGVLTDAGWVAIYPPTHTLLLALGVLAGAAWLVGPLMVGVATGAATWSIDRLAGAEVGRAAGLLFCVSPFWLLVGGTHLSHTTTAAALCVLLATSLRSRDAATVSTRIGWAVAAGVCAGVAVSARPWVGWVCGGAIVAAVWGPGILASMRGDADEAMSGWFARVATMSLGGLPFAVLLFWWNATLFGDPLQLGYSAAFGPSHGLGLHVDPWGNAYGAAEALGYTGADLLQLGIRLFESPLSATLVVGFVLVAAPPGAWSHGRVLGLWAFGGVVANAAYWHHGIHFGPRMTYEMVPAWIGLFALAVVHLARRGRGARGHYSRWVVGLGLGGGLALSSSTLLGLANGATPMASPAIPDITPAAESGQPDVSVVFVHGSWASRVGARLAAEGMRRDSIETALRRNDLCLVDRYARWRAAPDGPAPTLDFEPRPGTPPDLRAMTLSPGNVIRVSPTTAPDAACRREARSDRLGTLELEAVAWRSPHLTGGAVALARDLGPGANLRLFGQDTGNALVWVDRSEGEPLLLPYVEGMQLLWGGAGG